jgi:rubredoxin
VPKTTVKKTDKTSFLPEIYQCSDCLTVYDARFGALEVGITEGVPFADLDDNFVCTTCDGAKTGFVLMENI